MLSESVPLPYVSHDTGKPIEMAGLQNLCLLWLESRVDICFTLNVISW